MLDEDNSNLLNYNFKISDYKRIDNTLSNQNYAYSSSVDKQYIAIIKYNSKNASIEQYLINDNDTLDLVVPKESNFIISLYANRIISYTWNIKNELNNDIIEFENRSWIEISAPKSYKGQDGLNYDRQNFYFKSIASGKQELVMRYEHQVEEREDFFLLTLNIIIE